MPYEVYPDSPSYMYLYLYLRAIETQINFNRNLWKVCKSDYLYSQCAD